MTPQPIQMTLTVFSDLHDPQEARETLLKWLPTHENPNPDWPKSGVPLKPFGVWKITEFRSDEWHDRYFEGFRLSSIWYVPRGENWIDEDTISQSEALADWIGSTFHMTVHLDVGYDLAGTSQTFGMHATTGTEIRVAYRQIQDEMTRLVGLLSYAGLDDQKQQMSELLNYVNQLNLIPKHSELSSIEDA